MNEVVATCQNQNPSSAVYELFFKKIDEFKKNGFCVLEKVFSMQIIKACQQHLIDERRLTDKFLVHDVWKIDFDLFLSLSADQVVLDFCETVMGPFIQLDGLTLVALPPKNSDGNRRVAGWHRDPWGGVPRSSAFERPLAINALLYLQDLSDDVGPLRVCPRSHRKPLTISIADRRKPHPQEVAIYPEAGDVVLMHNNLVHAATPPASHVKERAFVSIFYNLSWLKQTISLTASEKVSMLMEECRQMKNYRLMRLLGEDITLVGRNDTGFLVDDESQWLRWIMEDRLNMTPD